MSSDKIDAVLFMLLSLCTIHVGSSGLMPLSVMPEEVLKRSKNNYRGVIIIVVVSIGIRDAMHRDFVLTGDNTDEIVYKNALTHTRPIPKAKDRPSPVKQPHPKAKGRPSSVV